MARVMRQRLLDVAASPNEREETAVVEEAEISAGAARQRRLF
jgi:hypothetical protein